MSTKHILIVPGDGIGQEVTAVAKKVLDKIAAKFNHTFTYDEALIGHAAIETTGNPLPDESLEKMRKSDAVLFGAVGHPKYDNDPSAKSAARTRLDLKCAKNWVCMPTCAPLNYLMNSWAPQASNQKF